ncbi:MAG TPA: hypothetical protein ENN17_01900 [bacterium]|nr:hypothetical protein [bacterium]
MKKYFALLLVLALAGGALAQVSDNHDVTMSVPGINVIALSNAGPIELTLVDDEDGNFATAAAVSGGNVSYRHNQSSARKVTANAGFAAGTFFDLTLAVDFNAEGDVDLIVDGVTAGDVDLHTNIAKGAYNDRSLEYSASATYDTEEGDYTCTVTYTMTAN